MESTTDPLLPLNEGKDTVGEVKDCVEYVAGEQILKHTNKRFHPNHHIYLANHSTTRVLIQLTDI